MWKIVPSCVCLCQSGICSSSQAELWSILGEAQIITDPSSRLVSSFRLCQTNVTQQMTRICWRLKKNWNKALNPLMLTDFHMNYESNKSLMSHTVLLLFFQCIFQVHHWIDSLKLSVWTNFLTNKLTNSSGFKPETLLKWITLKCDHTLMSHKTSVMTYALMEI